MQADHVISVTCPKPQTSARAERGGTREEMREKIERRGGGGGLLCMQGVDRKWKQNVNEEGGLCEEGGEICV